jgi:hypothetical protein
VPQGSNPKQGQLLDFFGPLLGSVVFWISVWSGFYILEVDREAVSVLAGGCNI